MLKLLTYAHDGNRGRPTLKSIFDQFWNGSVRELKSKISQIIQNFNNEQNTERTNINKETETKYNTILNNSPGTEYGCQSELLRDLLCEIQNKEVFGSSFSANNTVLIIWNKLVQLLIGIHGLANVAMSLCDKNTSLRSHL